MSAAGPSGSAAAGEAAVLHGWEEFPRAAGHPAAGAGGREQPDRKRLTGDFTVDVSACRLTPSLAVVGVSLDGLADVVAGGSVPVGAPGRTSGSGTGGFRRAGRLGG